VAKGELDLSKISGVEAEETDKEAQEKAQEAHKSMVEQMKTALGEDVKEVRISSRLVDSPACLVVEEQDMSANLARVLKQIGQDAPMPKPIMEINVDHPLLNRLEAEQDDERFNELARVLFDQALLAEGGQLDDPAGFVNRMNKLMLSMAS
jgi:molecular chaperone HtpG